MSDVNSKVIIGSARSMSLGVEKSVSEQPFYLHKLGWVVVVPKKAQDRYKCCHRMRDACENDLITYSQPHRGEIYYGIDTKKVARRCDCSSLCTEIIRETMLSEFPNSTTATFVNNCRNYPELFEIYDYDPNKKLYNGSFLCTKSKGHVVVVTHNGVKAKGGKNL